jgi:hypothetical protein
MDVFQTLSDEAVPLPDAFFDGDRDRRIQYDESVGGYRQVRGPTF